MKPFLHGKKTHSTPALRVPVAGAHSIHRSLSGSNSGLPDQPPAPTVETIKEGDKVVRLIVTCSCGEKIEVDCIYPAGS